MLLQAETGASGSVIKSTTSTNGWIVRIKSAQEAKRAVEGAEGKTLRASKRPAKSGNKRG